MVDSQYVLYLVLGFSGVSPGLLLLCVSVHHPGVWFHTMHYSSAISTAHPFGFLAGSDLNCNFFSLSSSSSPPPAHTDETDMSSSDLFATSSKPVVKCKSVPLDLSYTIWKDSIFIENQQHFIQNEEQICRRNFTLVDIYDHCNLRMLHAIAIVETSKRSHNWS